MEEAAATANDEDGFDWSFVEVYGHRSHWGRTKEVEQFGAKFLRVDVPKIEWQSRAGAEPEPVVVGWLTRLYGGASIFSMTPTDEASVLRHNRPYQPAHRYIAPPEKVVDEEHPIDWTEREED